MRLCRSTGLGTLYSALCVLTGAEGRTATTTTMMMIKMIMMRGNFIFLFLFLLKTRQQFVGGSRRVVEAGKWTPAKFAEMKKKKKIKAEINNT